MIAAPPRRFMKDSTDPLKAFLIPRSTLMVAVAYLAPARADKPRQLTHAAFASWANSAFHLSNPADVLPHWAADAAAGAARIAARHAPVATKPLTPRFMRCPFVIRCLAKNCQ